MIPEEFLGNPIGLQFQQCWQEGKELSRGPISRNSHDYVYTAIIPVLAKEPAKSGEAVEVVKAWEVAREGEKVVRDFPSKNLKCAELK